MPTTMVIGGWLLLVVSEAYRARRAKSRHCPRSPASGAGDGPLLAFAQIDSGQARTSPNRRAIATNEASVTTPRTERDLSSKRRWSGVSRPHRDRRRVRRHRNQPALRLFHRAQRHRPRGAHARGHTRHRIAHFLGFDAVGIVEIRATRVTRGQRRRGWHPGSAIAG